MCFPSDSGCQIQWHNKPLPRYPPVQLPDAETSSFVNTLCICIQTLKWSHCIQLPQATCPTMAALRAKVPFPPPTPPKPPRSLVNDPKPPSELSPGSCLACFRPLPPKPPRSLVSPPNELNPGSCLAFSPPPPPKSLVNELKPPKELRPGSCLASFELLFVALLEIWVRVGFRALGPVLRIIARELAELRSFMMVLATLFFDLDAAARFLRLRRAAFFAARLRQRGWGVWALSAWTSLGACGWARGRVAVGVLSCL